MTVMKPKNPFVLTSYISPEYFCDRKKETRRTIDAVTNGRNLVIFSLRRLGKTQLIKHSFHFLKNEKDCTVIYLDILHTRNLKEFTQAFGDAIFSAISKNSSSILEVAAKVISNLRLSLSYDAFTGQPSLQFDLRDAREAENTLAQLFGYLTGQKQEIVVAIDEFQQISHYPEKNVEALLRSLISGCGNVKFIFSGSSSHLLVSMFNSATQPFYGSAELMKLEKIEREEYVNFITGILDKHGKNINRETVCAVLDWCRDHTFYVQYSFNKLFNATDKKIEERDVIEIKRTILEENEPAYYTYYRLLTKTQWDLLAAIGNEPDGASGIYSNSFIQKHHLASTSSVRTAMHALLLRELIYEEDEKYFVYDVFLGRWLGKVLGIRY
ncbi:ATP-binding protein [Ignavibacteriales bacterium]